MISTFPCSQTSERYLGWDDTPSSSSSGWKVIILCIKDAWLPWATLSSSRADILSVSLGIDYSAPLSIHSPPGQSSRAHSCIHMRLATDINLRPGSLMVSTILAIKDWKISGSNYLFEYETSYCCRLFACPRMKFIRVASGWWHSSSNPRYAWTCIQSKYHRTHVEERHLWICHQRPCDRRPSKVQECYWPVSWTYWPLCSTSLESWSTGLK